jgi:hypothetical protein
MLRRLKTIARRSALLRRAWGRLYGTAWALRKETERLRDEAERRVAVPLRRRRLARTVEHVAGPARVPCGEEEMTVVCLVRDGAAFVQPFIEHYRALGAHHIAFLDNGSEDETVARARAHDDVTVLSSDLPFERYDKAMRQYLVERFAGDGWVLYADVDEFFDYPRSGRVPLCRFLRYLNRNDYTAVAAHMLELFPEGPLLQNGTSGDLRAEHRFYDLSEIEKRDYLWKTRNTLARPDPGTCYGGVRVSAFGLGFAPLLTKHPLVKAGGAFAAGDFFTHQVRGARVADVTGVLLHYHFGGDFLKKVRWAAERGHYYQSSRKYKQYRAALRAHPDLHLGGTATTRAFTGVDELVQRGFLPCSDDFLQWSQT